MMAGHHMVVGGGYAYNAVAAKRESPAAPATLVVFVPVNFGAIAISSNAEHPYASALFTDWMVSDLEQNYIFDHLRGPVTLKHPCLADDANIAMISDLPKEQLNPLVEEWRRDMEGEK
jgi:hypothetical protein